MNTVTNADYTATPSQVAHDFIENVAESMLAQSMGLPTPPHYEGNSAGSLTFKGHGSLDFKVVVNRAWLDFWRNEAKKEHTGAFMQHADAAHPTNDDAFIEAILRNGIRICLRENLVELLKNTGLGGTVAPAKVEIMAHIPGTASTAAIQVIEVAAKQEYPCTQCPGVA